MTKRLVELSDREVLQLLVEVLGSKRSGEIFLWCVLWAVLNPEQGPNATFEEIARGRLGWSRASYFRAWADLRRFRDELIRRGYVTDMTEEQLAEELATINAGLASATAPRWTRKGAAA